jgi:hypothetical protein
MHGKREKKRTCIGEERAINNIGLIISNILENLSSLIIPNRGSSVGGFTVAIESNFLNQRALRHLLNLHGDSSKAHKFLKSWLGRINLIC